MALNKAAKPDRSALFKGEPTPMDKALHGRLISRTQHGLFWRRTVDFLANYAAGTLYAALARSEVRFSLTAAPTACISLKTKKIFINPTFFRNWISTPSDMAGLLLHEMMHPIIDPDMKFARDAYDNIATDALINSTMFRISPILCSLMKKFYTVDRFSGSLLRPGARKQWRLASKDELVATLPAVNTQSTNSVQVNTLPTTTRVTMPGMEVPATTVHFDCYKNLFPTPKEAKTAVRPGVQEILDKFFPDLEERRVEAAKNGTVIICKCGGKTLSGYKPENTITLEELTKGMSPEEKAEIEKIIEELDEAHPEPGTEEGELPGTSESKPGEASTGGDEKGKPSGGAGKTGTLETHYVDIAAKEEVFKANVQSTLEERMRSAKDVLDGIIPQYGRYAFKPNEYDALSILTKRIDEFYLDTDILDAFNKASVLDEQGEIVDSLEFKPIRNRSFLPFGMTRSGVALLANGEIPVMWRKPRWEKEEQHKATRIYVDFSGSMSHQIPWCMRLLKEMKQRCNSDIYSFSTVIEPTTITKIEAGEYSTTGGTTFNEVIRHFVEECESEQCLIITDGQDSVSEKYEDMLTKSGKRAYGLIVESGVPSVSYVKNMQRWCKRVFLKERSWWSKLGIRP